MTYLSILLFIKVVSVYSKVGVVVGIFIMSKTA